MARKKKYIGRIIKHHKKNKKIKQLVKAGLIKICSAGDHNYCIQDKCDLYVDMSAASGSAVQNNTTNVEMGSYIDSDSPPDKPADRRQVGDEITEVVPLSAMEVTDNSPSTSPIPPLQDDGGVTFVQGVTMQDHSPALQQDDRSPAFNLMEVLKYLKSDTVNLPMNWSVTLSNSVLQLCKVSLGFNPVVQMCITVDNSGYHRIAVHGKELPNDHMVWRNNPNVIGNNDIEMGQKIENVFGDIDLYTVCTGNFENTYCEVLGVSQETDNYSNGTVMLESDFQETNYSRTLRSKNCQLLVKDNNRLCGQCKKLRKVLQTTLSRSQNRSENISARRPHSSLRPQELRLALKNYAKTSHTLKMQLNRMRKKMALYKEGRNII